MAAMETLIDFDGGLWFVGGDIAGRIQTWREGTKVQDCWSWVRKGGLRG
jgi:hypothetical protein